MSWDGYDSYDIDDDDDDVVDNMRAHDLRDKSSSLLLPLIVGTPP